MVEYSVDEFFSKLAVVKDNDGPLFPILFKFALSLATIYSSSSEAERDFSGQNDIVGDKRKSRMGQLKIQAKLTVRSKANNMKKTCEKCLLLKTKGQNSKHCHCSMMLPCEDLLNDLSDGQPYYRYQLSEGS